VNKSFASTLLLLLIITSPVSAARPAQTKSGLKVSLIQILHRGGRLTRSIEVRNGLLTVNGVEIPEFRWPQVVGSVRAIRSVEDSQDLFCTRGEYLHTVSENNSVKSSAGCVDGHRFKRLNEAMNDLENFAVGK
jgi:hypothetical protein